jgi:hypothetical protein
VRGRERLIVGRAMAPAKRKRAAAAAAAVAAAAAKWKVGDLVLAKMKGFPAWPAVVSSRSPRYLLRSARSVVSCRPLGSGASGSGAGRPCSGSPKPWSGGCAVASSIKSLFSGGLQP